jgi:hypothetical protein
MRADKEKGVGRGLQGIPLFFHLITSPSFMDNKYVYIFDSKTIYVYIFVLSLHDIYKEFAN